MTIFTPIILSLMLAVPHHAQSDLKCLASAIYHEARSEPLQGQYLVGKVILNRVKSSHYPSDICKVAYQKDQFTGLHGIYYDNRSMIVARMVYSETNISLPHKFKRVMSYHTTAVHPVWADWSKMRKVGVIGHHVFYARSD